MQDISKTRNFSIIAHIDHGKSTLSDRILEICGSVEHKDKKKDRILDTLDLEQEKGITIKLQPARLQYKGYTLNLIDTPGHVDFSYEVSRSLAACEGALLLVDATQGIQAQTISNAQKAIEAGLYLIPVINKIDMPGVNIEKTKLEIVEIFGFKKDDIVSVSGKTGENVEQLLDQVVEKIPAPKDRKNEDLRALVFDSYFDEHKGVILSVRVVSGSISAGRQNLYSIQNGTEFQPLEIGYYLPYMNESKFIDSGNVGYIATGEKDIKLFSVGATISNKLETDTLPGYQRPQANLFATFFSVDPEQYENLKEALLKLCLNDAALNFTYQKSNMLGTGFRCGFLGLLHMEIVQERLEREYDIELIITAPTVEYKVELISGEEISIQSASDLPDRSQIKSILEPWVKADILIPSDYLGVVMTLCQSKRGSYVDTVYLNSNTDSINIKYCTVKYDIPLASLISNFFDQLKNLTSGYGSMEYKFIDHFPVDLVKVDILINKKEIPVLSFLETRDGARSKAAKILEVMKGVIPRQQFEIPIQAAIDSRVIAREDIKAMRKDVTAKLYGGDYSRKLKVLERQKRGKKRLRQIGQVNIPQDAFLAILKT